MFKAKAKAKAMNEVDAGREERVREKFIDNQEVAEGR